MIHLVVFLISVQGYLYILYRYPWTKHNWEGRKKEQTNKHRLGSAQSARRGEVYVTLFVHSVFLWANVSVYSSENSHKATSNADLASRVGPQVLAAAFLTSIDWSPPCPTHLPDWPVLSTGPFCCFLPLTALSCRLSSSLGPSFPRPSGLMGHLVRRRFVWVSRQNRQRFSD